MKRPSVAIEKGAELKMPKMRLLGAAGLWNPSYVRNEDFVAAGEMDQEERRSEKVVFNRHFREPPCGAILISACALQFI